MKVVEVNNVSKSIGKRKIINNISFELEEHEICGFLGQNGAGKTTTIRMIVGLISTDEGSIKIMGHDIKKEREKAIEKLGCIIEGPDMYNYLTGRENLQLFANMYKDITKERIEEIINIIGLKERIDDKVKKYSLGMKQRLGLGQALLMKPQILVLDEPTNGLDPLGVIDFRNIIKKISQNQGITVLISTHILSEVEQVCDKVIFIDKGKIKGVEKIKDIYEKNETLEEHFIKKLKGVDENVATY